jgi:hypothetical protein
VQSKAATTCGAEAESSAARHRHGHRRAVGTTVRHGGHDPVGLGLTLDRVSHIPGYRSRSGIGKGWLCWGSRAATG